MLLEVCNSSASSSRWNTAWKHAPIRQLVSQATTILGCTSATNIPTWRPVTGHGHTHSSFTSAKCLVVSYTHMPRNNSSGHATRTRSSAVAEKLRDASCHWIFCWVTRGHSRSFEMTLLSRACVSPYQYFTETVYRLWDIQRQRIVGHCKY